MTAIRSILVLFISFATISCASVTQQSASQTLVMMTDFGVKDGAVSAMKGVAHSVAERIFIADLTHEIPPYNIWDAAYRLEQTWTYWKSGTVFVTVVDPGVGSERKPIVALAKNGSLFVGPDNGFLTLLIDQGAIQEVRLLDEKHQRLPGSEASYTFHGRDLFAFVGAKLAGGQLQFANVGPEYKTPLVRLPYQKAEFKNDALVGTVVVLDSNYGNVWSNIPKALVTDKFKDVRFVKVKILKGQKSVYDGTVELVNTFNDVKKGQSLAYYNSLLNFSLALNMDNFAKKYGIESGPDWSIRITRGK